jgi:hypothetical protein
MGRNVAAAMLLTIAAFALRFCAIYRMRSNIPGNKT